MTQKPYRNRLPSKEDPLLVPKMPKEEFILLQREVLSEKFITFVKFAWKVHHPQTPLKMNWHIEAICDHLQAQTEGHIQKLIINVPPGSGKSFLTQVYWPCWEWTFRPTTQILATAADESLSGEFNQKALWLLQSDWYQELFPLELRSDSQAKNKFTNEHFGVRKAVPFTSITGHRGDRVIIDDALSAANAESDALREKVNETYWNSATSRINDPDKSTFTIIQQRIHEMDLVGSVLERDDTFHLLKIPMEYVPTTYISPIGWKDPRTEEGEIMFPKHWSQKKVNALKAEGAYKFASQYQQNPVPKTDGFFDVSQFRKWSHDKDAKYKLPRDLNYYVTSDHSLGMSDRADYNVVRVWGIDEHKNLWLVDSMRKKCKLQEAMGISMENGKVTISDSPSALYFIKKYKPLAWFPEGDNNFKSIMGMVKDAMIANGIYCRIELASQHGSSKEAKAAAYQAASSNGQVYLPKGVVAEEALLEYQSFPKGRNDDQVDADSILPRMIQGAHAAVIIPEPKKRVWDDYVVEETDGMPENWHSFF